MTTTKGKGPARAKALELAGWSYDWLTDMGLVPAGDKSAVDTFIGYYRPYATSHDDLDADEAVFARVGNAAQALVNAVTGLRTGAYVPPDAGLRDPIEK